VGIIAYTAEGKPLYQKEFTSMIDEAILEADNGELIDQKEIEKEMWNGRKKLSSI